MLHSRIILIFSDNLQGETETIPCTAAITEIEVGWIWPNNLNLLPPSPIIASSGTRHSSERRLGGGDATINGISKVSDYTFHFCSFLLVIGSANCTTSSHIQTQTLQNIKALFFIIAFWIVAYCCFYALIPFQPKENLKFKQQHTIKNEHFFWFNQMLPRWTDQGRPCST